jgi:ribosomal protein L14
MPGVTKFNRVRLGDFIVVAVNKGQYKKKFSYKKVCFGLVLTRKIINFRSAGYSIRFTENRVLLFSNKEKTIGNKLYGFITLECKYFIFNRLIVLARVTL